LSDSALFATLKKQKRALLRVAGAISEMINAAQQREKANEQFV
jgi:hypothetical protein